MNILYFISVVSHGRGGHGQSLRHISSKMSEKHTVGVVSIGPGDSSYHQKDPEFVTHVFFNGLNIFKLKKHVNSIISNFQPDIIHFFDDRSYNALRIFIKIKKHKIILNKCGGPNPKGYPYISDIILFSQENLEWFHSNKKFKNSNLYLIPNRVQRINFDTNFHPIKKEKNVFNFVRICRIGTFHEKSILDSINLVEYLHTKGFTRNRLIVIGIVEDNKVFERIKQNSFVKKEVVKFLTEDIYTKRASKMLYLADAVLGTGRSLMEATSVNLPVLTFDADDNFPVLLNKDNFHSALQTNFSARNVFENLKDNRDNVIKLIVDKEYYKSLSDFSGEVYNKYFDIDKMPELYTKAYENIIKTKLKILIDWPLILKGLISYYFCYKQTNSRNNEKNNFIFISFLFDFCRSNKVRQAFGSFSWRRNKI